MHPTAIVHAGARIGRGSIVGPHCVIGPDVTIGERCRLGASVVVDGITSIGDETEIFPMASIGLAPQDLKYHGEPTRLVIGRRNIFREFVTINRGTEGGGGETHIGDGNLFMAYVHVAHDCHVGSATIFGPHATLGGHVTVDDYANVSAGIGGAPVLPRRALRVHRRLFGGDQGRAAVRAHHRQPSGARVRRQQHRAVAPRVHPRHHQSAEARLSLPAAVEAEHEPGAGGRSNATPALTAPEVRALVEFIRTSQRGVILRRPTRRAEELVAEE